jgi:hypothetical protein
MLTTVGDTVRRYLHRRANDEGPQALPTLRDELLGDLEEAALGEAAARATHEAVLASYRDIEAELAALRATDPPLSPENAAVRAQYRIDLEAIGREMTRTGEALVTATGKRNGVAFLLDQVRVVLEERARGVRA